MQSEVTGTLLPRDTETHENLDIGAVIASTIPGLRLKSGNLVCALLIDSVGDAEYVGATMSVCSRRQGPCAIVDIREAHRMIGHEECW